MQHIIIAGNIGKDAELKTIPSGSTVCSFSVGCNRKAGNGKDTTWYRCSLWGKRGEALAQYLVKGTRVCVAGELSASVSEGDRAYLNLDVNVSEIELMGGGAPRDDERGGSEYQGQQERQAASGDFYDDEIPF